MLIMHEWEFFTTRDSPGYRDWPQSNDEKRGAVEDNLFPAFISRVKHQISFLEMKMSSNCVEHKISFLEMNMP